MTDTNALSEQRLEEIRRWLRDETDLDPSVGQDELASIATDLQSARKLLRPDETSARDILQRLVDTCEFATGAPWPALDEARAFLSGLPEEPRETTPRLSESHANTIATDVVQNVCELPGYNSPDDQPELVMCTVTELHSCVMRAVEAFNAGSPEEPAGKCLHDEECVNCGAPWSRHLTNKLICPDAAIADIFRFGQKCSPEKATGPRLGDPHPPSCACWECNK